MIVAAPRATRIACLVVALALLGSLPAAGGAEPACPDPQSPTATAAVAVAAVADELDDDAPLVLPAGLRAEYKDTRGLVVTRVDTALQFSWSKIPPDPRLAAGDFTARWTGKLLVIAPGVYTIHLFAAGGAVQLTLNGKPLIERNVADPQWLDAEPVDLDYGHHALEVTFRRTSPTAQLGLYWSGARFQLEHVPARYLFHDAQPAIDDRFAEGRRLVRGLRCANCHDLPDAESAPLAPSLAKLPGNMSRAWLMDWIGGRREPHGASKRTPSKANSGADNVVAAESSRGTQQAAAAQQDIDDVKFRMPGLGLNRDDAQHIVALLMPDTVSARTSVADPDGAKDTPGDAQAGEVLFHSLGCLACHTMGNVGSPRLAGGGDLSKIGAKRPADFFARWLANPAEINPAHRMPIFPLDEEERQDLAVYLATRAEEPPTDEPPRAADNDEDSRGDAILGSKLVAAHHCGACHTLPTNAGKQAIATDQALRRPLSKNDTDWEQSCLGEPDVARARPGYRLRPEQRAAVISYWDQMPRVGTVSLDRSAGDKPRTNPSAAPALDGERIFIERNCTGCHSRGLSPGIARQLPAIAEAHPELARALAALAPPSLDDVGDKLEHEAIRQAVTTAVPPRRPWLKIRMPRFAFLPGEVEALADWLIAVDRLPANSRPVEGAHDDESLLVAGRRLVTSEGFGCASCHQIGKSVPKQDNLAALGTDLSLVGSRIRRAWFDRWVRNPARIVPRMEMPAIEIPVPGVLDDALADQLAAVWHVLNRPGFTPPAAGALRVVRTRNMPDEPEPAAILTDVLRVDKRAFVRPLVIGLANRHTMLFDCEENRLAGWWIGDAARERTEGKRWFWEPGGTHLLAIAPSGASELALRQGRQLVEPVATGQCAAELDSWRRLPQGVALEYRLTFDASGGEQPIELHVTQTVSALPGEKGGVRRRIEIRGAPSGAEIEWRPLPEETAGRIDGECFRAIAGPAGQVTVRVVEPEGAMLSGTDAPRVRLAPRPSAEFIVGEVEYTSDVSADRYPPRLPEPAARPAIRLRCVPGFDAVRLPLPVTEMPTGFAWRRDGTLMFTSLKGQVWLAPDTDGDGLPDTLRPLSDELAAPYGLAARGDAVDVINKNGLVRLSDFDAQGHAQRTEVVADGWGHTEDYHDWAVGLVSDGTGGYYVALPCRQNSRSDASARLRGEGLHLIPRTPTSDDPRRFTIEPFCAGLRFPMGLARSRAGTLFATDNQGNYNPFNELNHLAPGAHYGFFHKNETHTGAPPRRDPVVEIPHPWTRSVNGICFLDTPTEIQARTGKTIFGPWEGHLVGCEYDTRRLVRMSLEPIGDSFQGAVYPLSIEPAEGEETFEGPIACQVAPDGSLYVGNMRDSGWGAGQNTGSIVRLRPAGPLPAGIAEVRANADGFTLRFAAPVDRKAAEKLANYSIASFRRISTADYGGPDVDREERRIRAVAVSEDRQEARLLIDQMRPGFVYEIRVKNLAAPGAPFHPSEAYYTLRAVPGESSGQ